MFGFQEIHVSYKFVLDLDTGLSSVFNTKKYKIVPVVFFLKFYLISLYF